MQVSQRCENEMRIIELGKKKLNKHLDYLKILETLHDVSKLKKSYLMKFREESSYYLKNL